MHILPDENSKRFVAILNKKIAIGQLMNALGHMSVGLAGGQLSKNDMCLLEYRDKGNGIHPDISHFPFIVLRADNSNKIKTVREQAILRKIPFTDFTSTMTLGTSQEQINATANLAAEELDFYGIVLFGTTEELKEITGKFSLFK